MTHDELPVEQQRALDEVRRMMRQRKRSAAAYQAARAAEIASIKRAKNVGCSLASIGEAGEITRQMAWKLAQDDA